MKRAAVVAGALAVLGALAGAAMWCWPGFGGAPVAGGPQGHDDTRPEGPAPAHGASRGANVVVLLLDTLRADQLSSYGAGQDTSPEIDRIASEGVRFARPISQCTWTRPSIGSLITSRYPRTLGIYDERDQVLPDAATTLAEVLADNGYTNLAATANPNTNTAFNFQQGYQQYVDSTVRFWWMRDNVGEHTYKQAPLQGARDVFKTLLSRVAKLDSPPYHLMATVMDIHEAHDARVDLRAQASLFEGAQNRRYLQAIAKVSGDIAWFMGELKKLPGWEHTLLVIVSDHGEGLDSHPGIPASRWHGWLTYESQAVVPFILHSTGDELPRGLVVQRPVRLLDMMPTVLDLLGIEGPEHMQGLSLRSLLGNDAAPPALPEHFVVESQLEKKHSLAVYARDWKYMEHRVAIAGTDARELQPRGGGENGSATSVLGDHPALADTLRDALRAWERAHPATPPTLRAAPLSDEMEAQLKSLGYLGDAADPAPRHDADPATRQDAGARERATP